MLKNKGGISVTVLGVLLLAVAVILIGILVYQNSGQSVSFNTPSQTVLLSNGSVFYGKIVRMGTSYIELNDVFYVQRNVNPETKAVTNVLIKRGNEFHQPDRMILNRDHVLLLEPVSTNSKVADLITKTKKE